MIKQTKSDNVDDIDYTDNDYTDSNIEDKEYSSNVSESDNILDKPTMDKLFDCKELLIPYEKALKGESENKSEWVKSSDEQARNKFIDKTMNFLRVIINPNNQHTYMSEEDAERLLLEANTEYIKQALDEYDFSVEDEDLGTICESYDFAIQTFSGQFVKGHGSGVLRDIFAGLSQLGVNEKSTNEGFLSKLTKLYKGEV